MTVGYQIEYLEYTTKISLLVYLTWSFKNLNYIFTVADVYLLKNFIVKEWIYMKKLRSSFSLKIPYSREF